MTRVLRSHIGTHPDILAGLVRNDWTMQVMHALVRRVKEAVDENKAVAVIAYCRRKPTQECGPGLVGFMCLGVLAGSVAV